jgi:uncharacterized membrane protein YhaH (DUF805 family)
MNFNAVFANPVGRTARGHFIAGLIVLLAVTAFYFLLVKGRNGEWVLVTLLYPGFVLLARRLHDLGVTAWLLLVPLALMAATVWLNMFSHDAALARPVTLAALAVSAVFALWGCIAKGQAGDNRYGGAGAA